MEACLVESPRQNESTARSPASAIPWFRYGLIAALGVGVAWRVVRYLEGFPIWGDEAMLLLNILERDYAGLTQHLRFAQVAPLFFLWLEKTALVVFGPSEWSVHLFPFLAGLAALAVFWQTCRSSFSPRVAALAVAILAISYYPVRHSTEVKPYAFDLLFSVVFAFLTLGHLRNPLTLRWLIALVAVAPIAVFSSYPSVFVGGAVSLVLLMQMREASWPQRGLWLTFNVFLCGSFLVHYGFVGQQQIDVEEAQRTREFLHNYWKDAFPPENAVAWPFWLLQTLTGNMLAYPMGGPNGGSAFTFLAVALGTFVLWRNGQRSLIALCWLPFALNLLAAILDKYPFGGSARITLHLAPFIAILMAQGIVQALDWIGSPAWKNRCELGLSLTLIGFGVIGIARDVVKPYKTTHDREVRRLVMDLRAEAAGQTVLLCHSRDEELLAEFLWYARTQPWSLDWVGSASIPAEAKTCWLVMCGQQEPSAARLVAHLGSAWRMAGTEVRAVPGENARMPTVYCRWVRMVRD